MKMFEVFAIAMCGICLGVSLFALWVVKDMKSTITMQNEIIVKLTDALNQTSEALQNSTKLLNKVAEVPE